MQLSTMPFSLGVAEKLNSPWQEVDFVVLRCGLWLLSGEVSTQITNNSTAHARDWSVRQF